MEHKTLNQVEVADSPCSHATDNFFVDAIFIGADLQNI
jgi:hypothetical protein